MKEDTLPTKELLLAIPAMRKQAEMLYGKNKPYEVLLTEILKYDYYDESDNVVFRNGKALQQLLQLSPTKFRKQIVQIHTDIFDMAFESAEVFNFTEVEYYFYIKCWGKTVGFTGKLPVRPMVGEDFEFPFLRGTTTMHSFHVERVQNQFTDSKQIITVWLKCGIYNSYEQIKKDKEELEEKERNDRYWKMMDERKLK